MAATLPIEKIALEKSATTGSPSVGKASATGFVLKRASIPPTGTLSRHWLLCAHSCANIPAFASGSRYAPSAAIQLVFRTPIMAIPCSRAFASANSMAMRIAMPEKHRFPSMVAVAPRCLTIEGLAAGSIPPAATAPSIAPRITRPCV